MASVISAGTSTGSALNMTGDTSGALALATNNGTTAVTIDTSQNVGIGTTSPGSKLTINGGTANTIVKLEATDSQAFIAFADSSATTAPRLGGVGDALSFQSLNTERMRITSDGYVGVGTSSPSSSNTEGIAFIPGTSSSASITGSSGGGQVSLGNNNGGSNVASDATCGTIAFKARFNGTFGGGNDVASIVGTYTGNGTTRSGAIRFLTINSGAEAERVRINSSGHFLVGTTSTPTGATSNSFYNNSSGVWPLNARGLDRGISTILGASEGYGMYFERNQNSSLAVCGYIYLNSNNTTTYATSSDYRLKENVTPMVGALDKVTQLKPCAYTWKSDGSNGDGFIAHELQEVCPQAVHGVKDAVREDGSPEYQGIDTSFLVATLTAAIQELKVIVDAQAVEIAALKTQVGA